MALLTVQQQSEFMIHIVGANNLPQELDHLFREYADFVVFHGYLTDGEVGVYCLGEGVIFVLL